ncbi:MAG: hypothetical protein R3Y15_06935 [Rikenellaceae bacterium]
MKTIKKVLIFLCCMLLSHDLMAQINTVSISMDGSKVTFGVFVEGLGVVVVDSYGNIVRASNRRVYDSHNVGFEYYSSFSRHEAGKIKKIGSVSFTYYSTFNDYEAGKIKSIGGKAITYYSGFHDYEAGKLKSVAGVKISYYSDFNKYEAGKLKSIGRHKYEYFSGFGDSDLAGRPKSGHAKISVDGIDFNITARNRVMSR